MRSYHELKDIYTSILCPEVRTCVTHKYHMWTQLLNSPLPYHKRFPRGIHIHISLLPFIPGINPVLGTPTLQPASCISKLSTRALFLLLLLYYRHIFPYTAQGSTKQQWQIKRKSRPRYVPPIDLLVKYNHFYTRPAIIPLVLNM